MLCSTLLDIIISVFFPCKLLLTMLVRANISYLITMVVRRHLCRKEQRAKEFKE